jgi:hypothetical protein
VGNSSGAIFIEAGNDARLESRAPGNDASSVKRGPPGDGAPVERRGRPLPFR